MTIGANFIRHATAKMGRGCKGIFSERRSIRIV